MLQNIHVFSALGAAAFLLSIGHHSSDAHQQPAQTDNVSYYKQVRPIFQTNCLGCHQPARSSGGFVMTAHDKLLEGGSSGKPAIVPKNTGQSHLVAMITPHDGKALMPHDKKPLEEAEIDLVKRWIAQGAVDDTPLAARQRFDMDNPPFTRVRR